MISVLLPATLFAALKCEISTEALMRYERSVLSSRRPAEMIEPLSCILEIHETSEGLLRVFAASQLRTLFGGGQIQGVLKDARYKRVSEAIEQLTLKNKNPLYQSVVAQYAKGDWKFYELFCVHGSTEFCKDFMPDRDSLRKESPLLAAASLVRLKNAYLALSGDERAEIAKRLKKLHKEIPATEKLQRHFIDQIHRELFESPHLSPA